MTKSPPKDIGASVRARLLRLARERGEDFQLLLTRYANERLLFRLASTKLAREFEFYGELLTRAIRATFERRMTPLPTTTPVALTAAFGDDPTKRTQWSGFVRKAGVRDVGSLTDTISAVAAFIAEPLAAAATGRPAPRTWTAGGPWT